MTHTVREKSAYMASPNPGSTPPTQAADRPVVSSGARVKQEAFDHSVARHMSPPPTLPLRERKAEQPQRFSFPSFPSSSSSSISPAALDRKSDPAPPQAPPDLPRQERPARAWAVKREPRVKPEPAALTTAPPQPDESDSTTTTTATRGAGRQAKRKAEPLTAQPDSARTPIARLDSKQTPSSTRVAGPPAAPPGPAWQVRIDQLLDQATQDESQPVTLPAGASAWRAWRESLQQVLPALEKALAQERPPSVDAAPTEAEARLLDLVYTLTELAGQVPAVLPPGETQAWKALVRDTVPRLARAAAVPTARLADVPALRRALDGLSCDGQSHHRAEVLALRLGGATMRAEHRGLVVRHCIDQHLAADRPPRWVPPPVDAFARMAVLLAATADGERFAAGCIKDGLRRVLRDPVQLPPDPAECLAALLPLRRAISAFGQALRGLPGLSPRQLAPVVQAILAESMMGTPALSPAGLRPLVSDLPDALGWSDAGCADYAQAMFAAVLDHAVTSASLTRADQLGLVAGSLALRGASGQIARMRAALLRQVTDARRPNGDRLSTPIIAAFVQALAFARETLVNSPIELLRALSHLPLNGATELLRAVSNFPQSFNGGFAQGISTALAHGTHGLSAPRLACLALAWGLANRERGEPWLLAQFPPSALGNENANVCRQAMTVAIGPSRIFAIPAFDTTDRVAVLGEVYRLPVAFGVEAQVNDLVGYVWPSGLRWSGRLQRTGALAELFEGQAAQARPSDLLLAHAIVLRDTGALLASAEAAPMHAAALDAARRFYQALPACLAAWHAGDVAQPGTDDARDTLMMMLEEIATDLRLTHAPLRDIALPVVHAEHARLQALLPAPPAAEPQPSALSADPM